jgi:monoamine oxidase
MEVIVVGAGLAGLHAAWLLERLGHGVTVLEARDRVGGRTWSQALPDGAIVERGGEFIAPGQAAIRSLCAELGLPLVPHGFSFDRRVSPDGTRPTVAEIAAVNAAVARCTRARLSAGADDLPLAEAFAEALGGDPQASPVYRRLATSTTVRLDTVSARWYCAGGEHGYDDADHVRGGNQRITLALASGLRRAVRTDAAVAGVATGATGVAVTTEAGEELQADAAVVAVPLPGLRALAVELPPAVAEAVAHTHFGDAAKLHLALEAEVAPRGVAHPSALWWTWNSSGASLSAFAGALDGLDVASGPGAWAEQAAALRPDVAVTGVAALTHWGAERWTGGSYSAPALGWRPEHDAAWTVPHGRVAFAGEHTAGPLAASMDGAVASGAAAARRLHEDHG